MVYTATVPGPFINQHVCPAVLSSDLPEHASSFHGFTSHYLNSLLHCKQHSEHLSAHCNATQNMFHSCPFLSPYYEHHFGVFMLWQEADWTL